eukprot:1244999-Alexandrium_andersonii.AAC.1
MTRKRAPPFGNVPATPEMLGPPSRWAPRNATGRGVGSAAPWHGGLDPTGPAAVEEPAPHSMADSTERS